MADLRLFDNLPLNAQMLDQSGAGILQHICDSVQPFYNDIYRLMNQMPEFLDPDLIPGDYLDWFGQWVGLGTLEGGHWQGTGINPCWPDLHKRDVIKRASRYWLAKGSEWGVKEAIALWLQWPGHDRQKFILVRPFGKVTEETPPSWHGWNIPYNSHVDDSFSAVRRLGHRSLIGGGRPNYDAYETDIWKWDWDEPWSDRHFSQVWGEWCHRDPSMGPRRPWMHFDLNWDEAPTEWNQIFSDVHLLNPEIWSAWARPTTVGWLNLRARSPLIQSENEPRVEIITEYDIDGFTWGDLDYGVARPWPGPLAHCQTPDYDFHLPEDLAEIKTIFLPEDIGGLDDLFPCCVPCGGGIDAVLVDEPDEPDEPDLCVTEPNQLAEEMDGGFDFDESTLHAADLGLTPLTEPLPVFEEILEPINLDFSFLVVGGYPNGYRWIEPIGIALWGDYYGYSGPQWFSNAVLLDEEEEISTAPETAEAPAETPITLCNTWMTWGAPIVETIEREVIHEEENLSILETYPQLEDILEGDCWQLFIESDQRLYEVRPGTMAWTSADGTVSQVFSVEQGLSILRLEFLLDIGLSEVIRSIRVVLADQTLITRDFYPALNSPGVFGIRAMIDCTPADLIKQVEELRPIYYGGFDYVLSELEIPLYDARKRVKV